MGIERTALSELEGQTILKLVKNGQNIEFLDARGRVMFQVIDDHLFDCDGNYFEDDLDDE